MTPIERRETEAELMRINQQEIAAIREMTHVDAVRWAGPSLSRIQQVAIAKGYKPGWVRHAIGEAQA